MAGDAPHQPLTAAQLIPNRALKDVIEAALAAGLQDSSGGGSPFLAGGRAAAAAAAAAAAPVSFLSSMIGGGGGGGGGGGDGGGAATSSFLTRMMGSQMGNGDPRHALRRPPATLRVNRISKSDYYHLEVSAEDKDPLNTMDVVLELVVDISASMGNSSVDERRNGSEVTAAYSRSDLVRHAVNVVIESIAQRHALGITLFDGSPYDVLPICDMTPANKAAARTAAAGIGPMGSTNVHIGLLTGLRKIEAVWRADRQAERNRKYVIVVQTDGDTDEPPCEGGIGGALKAWCAAHPDIDLTVHTIGYGFGSALCTDKLERIALAGKGMPLYISDGNMVVTVIAHLLANCTSALYSNIRVCIPDTGQVVELGDLQGGKPRNVLVQIPQANFNVKVMSGSATLAFAAVDAATAPDAGPEAEVTAIHQGLVTAMQQALVLARRADFGGASRALDVWYDAAASSPAAGHPMVMAMLSDVRHADTTKGQISLGVRTADNWERWGQHFLPQSIGQHTAMWAVEFKGACSDAYRLGTMEALYDEAVAISNNLPPPTMSRAAYCAPTVVDAARTAASAALCRRGGGCWAPGTMILLEDGLTRRPVEDLRAGDTVWTPDGPARVEHALVLGRYAMHQDMCTYMTLCITPYHPILVNGVWTTAIQFVQPVLMHMPTVYNLVLDRGHVVNANSVLTCTLGHGMSGPVIGHDFFGSKDRILAAISAQPGFAVGRPVYANLVPMYDMTTSLITGWWDDVTAPPPAPVTTPTLL